MSVFVRVPLPIISENGRRLWARLALKFDDIKLIKVIAHIQQRRASMSASHADRIISQVQAASALLLGHAQVFDKVNRFILDEEVHCVLQVRQQHFVRLGYLLAIRCIVILAF